jgi:hypothetical protein
MTLNSGHMTIVREKDISQMAIDHVAKLLDAGGGPVGVEGYSVSFGSEGDNLAVFTIFNDKLGAPLTTNFVCDGCYDHAWDNRILPFCREMKINTDVQKIEEPFIATAVLPTSMLDPSASEWIGDFERCVGWTMMRG